MDIEPEDRDDILEDEEGLVNSSEIVNKIYPNAEVRVEKAQFSILHLRRLCEDRKELIIDPDFQRSKVWGYKQGAELVESILMGIPIPTMYLFETRDGKKQVVDGRQRITSILDFLNGKFSLNNLKILTQFNGLYFKELDSKMQGVFEDYQLSFYIIQPPTPERVKYDIFDRVNRGGTQLNSQEMRNALYRGKATCLLAELSATDAFKKATGQGINPKRMRDRYIILRAISFYLLKTGQLVEAESERRIEYKSDIDDFLAKVMIFLNEKASSDILERCKSKFIQAMDTIYRILGEDAFRFDRINTVRRPINMPLFEVLTYLFTFDLPVSEELIREKVISLKQDFDNSGLFRTNVDSTNSVDYRFGKVDELIKKLKNDNKYSNH